jgi:hypothetical protein
MLERYGSGLLHLMVNPMGYEGMLRLGDEESK